MCQAEAQDENPGFVVRLFFCGIYFPQASRRAWMRLVGQNWPTVASLLRSAIRQKLAANQEGPQPAGSGGGL